jgi:hypothetical protein
LSSNARPGVLGGSSERKPGLREGTRDIPLTPALSRRGRELSLWNPLPPRNGAYAEGPRAKGKWRIRPFSPLPTGEGTVRGSRCTQTLSLPEKTWRERRAGPSVEFHSREALLSARNAFLAAAPLPRLGNLPVCRSLPENRAPPTSEGFSRRGVCLTALWLCSENSPWTSLLGW